MSPDFFARACSDAPAQPWQQCVAPLASSLLCGRWLVQPFLAGRSRGRNTLHFLTARKIVPYLRLMCTLHPHEHTHLPAIQPPYPCSTTLLLHSGQHHVTSAPFKQPGQTHLRCARRMACHPLPHEWQPCAHSGRRTVLMACPALHRGWGNSIPKG
jgi:hypothetical protein